MADKPLGKPDQTCFLYAMLRATLLFVLSLQASAALSQEAMTPEEFEAYTTGKTLTFGSGGTPYGGEQYLSNRRVIWSFLDGQCKDGQWFVDLDLICFVYDDDPTPQCWSFFKDENGLTAQYENDEGSPPLYQVGESQEPLMCLGPEVGV